MIDLSRYNLTMFRAFWHNTCSMRPPAGATAVHRVSPCSCSPFPCGTRASVARAFTHAATRPLRQRFARAFVPAGWRSETYTLARRSGTCAHLFAGEDKELREPAVMPALNLLHLPICLSASGVTPKTRFQNLRPAAAALMQLRANPAGEVPMTASARPAAACDHNECRNVQTETHGVKFWYVDAKEKKEMASVPTATPMLHCCLRRTGNGVHAA